MSLEAFLRIISNKPTDSVRHNYIIPGLTSRLFTKTFFGQKVRIFEMGREQETEISIHDHRYSFNAFVLDGSVTNKVWKVHDLWSIDAPVRPNEVHPSSLATHVRVAYAPGNLAPCVTPPNAYVRASCNAQTFTKGSQYSMDHTEYHSIRFSKGARVLLIEELEAKSTSSILLPFSNGRVCDTFYWKDWMME